MLISFLQFDQSQRSPLSVSSQRRADHYLALTISPVDKFEPMHRIPVGWAWNHPQRSTVIVIKAIAQSHNFPIIGNVLPARSVGRVNQRIAMSYFHCVEHGGLTALVGTD